MGRSDSTHEITEEIVSSHIPKVELFEAKPGAKVDGRFELIKKIGEGGMGVVYLAKQINIGRDVVIKLLKPHLCSNEEQVNRFRREASLASRLSHPNCVTIHDFGFYQGTPYIVMEYLEGAPLVEILYRRGQLPFEETISILSQTCDALEAARALEVVHRDLKPENIFILSEAIGSVNVKVLDFGIAKLAHTHPEASDSNLTRGDMIFGTPQYMSPEQIRGKPIDHRADVYALTVIFYEMVAGHLPYDQEDSTDVVSILTQHLRDPVPLLKHLPAQLMPMIKEINHLFLRGMAKDLESRITCAQELKLGLTDLLTRVQSINNNERSEPSLTPQLNARPVTRPSLLLSPLDQVAQGQFSQGVAPRFTPNFTPDLTPSSMKLKPEDLLPHPVVGGREPSLSQEPSSQNMRASAQLLQPSPTLSSPNLSELSPMAESVAPQKVTRQKTSFLGSLIRFTFKTTIWATILAFMLSILITYPRSPLGQGEFKRLIQSYLSADAEHQFTEGERWVSTQLHPFYVWIDQQLGLNPLPLKTPQNSKNSNQSEQVIPSQKPKIQNKVQDQTTPDQIQDQVEKKSSDSKRKVSKDHNFSQSDSNHNSTYQEQHIQDSKLKPTEKNEKTEKTEKTDKIENNPSKQEPIDEDPIHEVKKAPRWLRVIRDFLDEDESDRKESISKFSIQSRMLTHNFWKISAR